MYPSVSVKHPYNSLYSIKKYAKENRIKCIFHEYTDHSESGVSHMIHLTQVPMSTVTWKDRDGNVYDKCNAPKWLQDYSLIGVEIAHK